MWTVLFQKKICGTDNLIYFSCSTKTNCMEQPSQGNVFPQTPPKNWLVESILVTIFCCLPFGIVGIVNAAQVNSRVAAGDFIGAARASREAGKWTKIGFFCGIAGIVLYFIAIFFFGATAFWASRHNYNY